MSASRPITLGILANEFFATGVGRMGGFGWAVSQVARLFAGDPGLGVTPIIIAGEAVSGAAAPGGSLHGVSFVPRTWNRWSDGRRLRAARPDVLLTIDFRPSYRRVLRAVPDAPVIVWIRDPRTPADNRLVASVRIPGRGRMPEGLGAVNCGGLSLEVERRRRAGTPIHLAVTDPFLIPKVEPTYGVPPVGVTLLPNPIGPGPERIEKCAHPTVVFLGRLDPYKRPWVFVALAERFPDVRFLMLGQAHFSGPGAWQPDRLPANVVMLGQADEAAKRSALGSAWLLVNTSVHEGLAVSFLEALSFETPLVAMVDAGGLVSRYGLSVPTSPGTGLDGLDALAGALAALLADRDRRDRLGREGRAWVAQHHGRRPFLAAFSDLVDRVTSR
jgi:glycosyltransferase involved in cell wall biosynthesis